jgi:hypothetical protein
VLVSTQALSRNLVHHAWNKTLAAHACVDHVDHRKTELSAVLCRLSFQYIIKEFRSIAILLNSAILRIAGVRSFLVEIS